MKKLFFIICVLFFAACVDKSSDYSECVEIELARCELRSRCFSSFDLDGCKYYYKEQCRARKIKTKYTDTQFDECIGDIEALGSPNQCDRLSGLSSESEVCVFEELLSCREFLCEAEKSTTSSSGGSQGDDVPSGLNPSE